MTFVKSAALALDDWAASIFFNKRMVCVSSLTWVMQNHPERLSDMYAWQRAWLARIGPWLDRHWPNHRAAARQGDLNRLAASQALLSD
jgi:hypothetical protein